MKTIFSKVKLRSGQIVQLFLLVLLSAVGQMLLPSFLAQMISHGVAEGENRIVWMYAVIMAGVTLFSCVISFLSVKIASYISTDFAAQLRTQVFSKVQEFSAAEMDRFGTASLVTRSTSDITNVQNFLTLLLRVGLLDDVFVIVMFTAFTGLAQGDQVSAVDFINIPISIAVGALAGFLIGFLSAEYFKKIHIRDTSKVIILVCVSFLLVTFEDEFASVIPFASLIAVMTMGIALQQKRKNVAKRLSAKFNKLWVGAEVMLFVLVGATVDIRYAVSAGVVSIVLIFAVLVFRMLPK